MAVLQELRQKMNSDRLREIKEEALWVWQYIRRYRGTVAVHILLGMLGIVMSLGSSVASKFLIDAVIGYDSGMIGLAAALMVGMRLGNIAMKSIAAQVGAAISIRVQNGIQGEMYSRILSTDWQSLEQFRSGDLLNRLGSDASAVSGGVTGLIPALFTCGVQFLGSFIIILHYDMAMAFIALIGVPLTGLCSSFLLRRMRRHNREMKEVYSDVVSFQQDSFQNITSIKAFGLVDWFSQRMGESHEKYRDKYLEYNQFSVWTSALMNLLSLVAYIGCFGWGVYRLWQGRVSYGEMTMFMQLAGMLGSAFSSLVGLVPTAISVATSAGRLMAVVELPAEERQGDAELAEEEQLHLQLEHVSFSYTGGAPVLQDAHMTVAPGQLVCLMGPSGEGKTTLLRIILGLVRPTAGTAVLRGSSGREYPLSASTRAAFGYVPQGNQIFNGTIAENLRLGCPDASEEEMMAALKIACADEFVMALPDGLQHIVGGRDKRLSEGQSQRLAVARAVLRRAPILLLDEATSALDTETETKMLQNLMDSGVVHTCILVTHRPAAREICSRCYHIRDGVVREEAL